MGLEPMTPCLQSPGEPFCPLSKANFKLFGYEDAIKT